MDTENKQQELQQQTPEKPIGNKRSLSQFLPFGFVLLVIGFIIGLVVFHGRIGDKKQPSQYPLPSHTAISPATVSTSITASNSSHLKTFKNDTYTFQYPTEYKYQFFGSALYIGSTQGAIPLGPNGSCNPGGIQIINRWMYDKPLMQDNFDNLQMKSIPYGNLYTGIQKPGACGGITHHIAQMQYKSNMVEISLDDNPQDLPAFNTIVSTFSFEK